MPPKSRPKGKDPQQQEREEAERTAKQQEEARQAQLNEQLRREQDERAIRDAEAAAEIERQRQMAIRQQAELEQQQRLELERKQREKEREIQQMQLLDEKDQEVAELKQKVLQLHRAAQTARADADAELATSRRLQEELDVARARLDEFEEVAERDKESLVTKSRTLSTENDTLRQQLKQTESALETTRLNAEREEQTLRARIDELTKRMEQETNTRNASQSESAVLMKVLSGELEKHRAQNQELSKELERREKDDVKNTVLLGILKSQLDSTHDEVDRGQEVIAGLKKQNAALTADLEKANARVAAFDADMQALRSAHNEELEQRTVELSAARTAQAAAQSVADRASRALEQLREKAAQDAEKALETEKEQIQKIAQLTAELQFKTTSLETAQDALLKKEREFFERTTHLQGELDSANQRLAHVTQQLERSETESFQTATTLRAEKEQLLHKIGVLEREVAQTQRDAYEREATLKAELTKMKTDWDSDRRSAEAKEREHFVSETTRTAEMSVQGQQLAAARAELAAKQAEYVDQTVKLHAEKESLKARLTLLETETSRDRSARDKEVADLAAALEAAKRVAAEEKAELLARVDAVVAERTRFEEQAKHGRESLKLAEEEAAKREKDTWDRITAYKAEISALRAENDTHKETIGRLETSVGESFASKVLEEQNAQLRADIESHRLQIKNLHATITTMKLESEILDSYKTKVLSETSDAQQRRVAELEREHRLIAPLIQELVGTLRRNDLLTPQLQQQIDTYRQQYHAVVATAGGAGSQATSTQEAARPASSGGLPRLAPMARPGSATTRTRVMAGSF